MILDAYTHIMPKDYISALLQRTGPDFDFAELQAKKGYEQFVDIETRLKQMDSLKVDMHLLGLPYAVPELDASLCRLSNDSISQIVNKKPDRFLGLASVPLKKDHVGEAVDELRRATRDLGNKGVILPCKLPGLVFGDVELRPFFESLASLDLPLFLMPADPTAYPELQGYSLGRIYGWPFSTTIAIATIAFSGILEDYPRLKVVAHHLGGMIPFYAGRMESFSVNPKYQSFMKRKLNRSILEYAKMTYADTALTGYTPALECAVAFYGTKHILFGTDYPMGPKAGTEYPGKIIKSINSLKVPEEEKADILWNNAASLLKIN